ncbi:hypothetical protein D3C71_1787350 [compost metagenome]
MPPGLFDHNVSGRFDTGIPGSQQELGIISIVLAGKCFDKPDHRRQRVSLVIAQIDIKRQQAAAVVVKPARCASRDHVQHALIGKELVPLRVGLVQTNQHFPVQQR